MWRVGLLALVLSVAGCEALRDAFSPHADVAARAADQTLSTDRLAELIAHVKRVPVTEATVTSVAYLWVDYTLFAVAVASGEDFTDSATVLAATWPLVSQRKWERFHERISIEQAELSERQVDSAFEAGAARVFQHILLRVPRDAGPDAEGRRRSEIAELLRVTRSARGMNFAQLATQYSDDPGTRTRGGYLGVTQRGDPLVPEFRDVAWTLAPGEISGVVRSAYGYHLIRRPPLQEVRAGYHAGLEARLQHRLDSLMLDSIAVAREVEITADAPALIRQSLEHLYDAWESDRVLVKFQGGRFRMADFVRWVHALEPQVVQQLATLPEDQIRDFLELLTQRYILVLLADSAGVQLDASDWSEMRAAHDSALATLRSMLSLTPDAVDDSAATEEVRIRHAMAQVNDYVERLMSGRAQYVPVPPFFGAELRRRGEWRVRPAGVAQAVERARTARALADSLSADDGKASVPTPATPVPGAGGGGR